MEKIKVGIVGLGRLGYSHAENLAYHIPNCELTAVCTRTEETVKRTQEKLNVPYGYTEYNEMLDNKELDAVFIASPSNLHSNQVIKALQAGFHVFTEKPLGLTVKETEKVAKVVEEHPNQIFMLGFMRRYDESYMEAKKLIDEGHIGKPVMIRSYGLDPAANIEGILKYATGGDSGGIFLDMGVHDLDIARWLIGLEAKEVWALGGSYAYPQFDEIGDAETVTAMVNFEEGVIGVFALSRNAAHGAHVETEIIGTKGSLQIGTEPSRNKLTIFDEKGIVKNVYEDFYDRFRHAFRAETEEFINCIIEKRQPEVTAWDGVEATRLAYACKASLDSGEKIKIN